MVERRWVQSAGVAGILFVILIVVGALISGGPPDSTRPTAEMVSYISSNRGALLASGALGAAASVFLLWFAGVLSTLLRLNDGQTPLGSIVLAAGAASTAIGALAALPLTTLAFVANQAGGLDTSPSIRVIFEFSEYVAFAALNFTVAVFLAALGAGMLRRVFASTWLGWLSLAVAAVNVVAGVLTSTSDSSAANVVSLISLISVSIVVLALSVYLLRSQPSARG